MALVFDSNILIDLLRGHHDGRQALNLTTGRMISVITRVEVLAGTKSQAEDALARSVLRQFETVPLRDDIVEEAVQLRKSRSLKLPDAVILATARCLNVQLVTRNTKDFPEGDSDILVPYRL